MTWRPRRCHQPCPLLLLSVRDHQIVVIGGCTSSSGEALAGRRRHCGGHHTACLSRRWRRVGEVEQRLIGMWTRWRRPRRDGRRAEAMATCRQRWRHECRQRALSRSGSVRQLIGRSGEVWRPTPMSSPSSIIIRHAVIVIVPRGKREVQ